MESEGGYQAEHTSEDQDIRPTQDILHWLRTQDWRDYFDPRTLARGQDYARRRRPQILSIQDGHIRAQCQGSLAEPYRQSIFLGKNGQRLHCACNCPAAMNCKHAVAVIERVLAGATAPLAASLPASSEPTPSTPPERPQRLAELAPVALLTLGSHLHTSYDTRSARMVSQAQHRAGLAFRYGDNLVHGRPLRNPPRLQVPQGTEWLSIARDTRAEQALRDHLIGMGFRASLRQSHALPLNSAEMFQLNGDKAWLTFIEQQLPKLRQQGWEVHLRPGFHFDLSSIDSWYANIEEDPKKRWFDLELGIVVNGQKISLLPILLDLMRRNPQLLSPQQLRQHADDEQLHLQLDAKRNPEGSPLQVMLPFGRLKPILTLLSDAQWRDNNHAGMKTALRLNAPDAARLNVLNDLPLHWHGGERVRQFAQSLQDYRRLPLDTPSGLNAQLRPYQQEGLMWMQTLQKLGVGGILGDDMGLGKTLQVLAHLLLEKQAGRLQAPGLVVVPTSLIFNWLDEASRFAPGLKVAALHGPQRQSLFDNFDCYDVLLTTYSLLPKDLPRLRRQPFSLLVFDEAQNLKNPAGKAAIAARQLQAKQRLCLTGTPLENHLGELWALFDLLMPGWLGDARQFGRDYRSPIEKQGDGLRLEQLRARIHPFLLRRRKDQVARELPAKSEVLQWVELGETQRDRYEALRLAMDQRVREAINSQGLARSRMLILDALLKLRQVCCDLRLIGEPTSAADAEQSGKLGSLMEMLEELLASGRRVLLFSQFTSMLALIEQALQRRGLPYLLLTGDTQDRRTPVHRFQRREVPLFLISLKAGGTGLNLTAADTVIHYDPWWNPAVENQATDRAYRIGQDKPVFVYKLIAQGTVEERIHQLQQRKSELARNILENPGEGDWQFDEEDVQTLFAPLPNS